MRLISLSSLLVFSTLVFPLLTGICLSAEVNSKITESNMKNCAEGARLLSDLAALDHKITPNTPDNPKNAEEFRALVKELERNKRRPNVDSDKKSKIFKTSQELQNYIESTCPRTGFKCETFESRPERNNCKPFKILTNDRFVLENKTYN